MDMNRRSFLGKGALFAASALGGCRSFFTGSAADYDESLTVFLSDMHIGSSANAPKHQPLKFGALLAEILRMDPLPRRVVVFGDISYKAGLKGDYVAAFPFFKQLTDAGIQVTLGMGNHDRRPTFLEVWPEYAASSPVPGRIVSVVPLQHADLVLLDSLKSIGGGQSEAARGYGEGELGAEQEEWLADWMAKATRPFFLASHHPEFEPPGHSITVKGKRIDRFMYQFPHAAGYIHGHNHMWRSDFAYARWWPDGQIPVLGLPSAGYWGDIGYVLFRTSPNGARATLRQTEHFFPRWKGDVTDASAQPLVWRERTRANDGQTCLFTFPRAWPWNEKSRDFSLERY